MKSLQGHLLIASPELRDPNFHQTIVLIIGHNDDGAMGLVLNRPSETSIREAWEQVRDSHCERSEPVHVGGPCPGPLMALHGQPLVSNAEVIAGIYLTQSPELLEQLVGQPDGAMGFYVGYAGWGAGQLECELAEGAWQSLPTTADLVFSPAEQDWERLLRRAGSADFYASLGFRHVPPDPNIN